MSEGQKFGYEPRDVNLPAIGKFVFGLFVFTVVSLVAMKILFGVFLGRQIAGEPPPPPMVDRDQVPPLPRLETYEGQVVAEVRAYEEPLLKQYSWIDREAGVARIPVARAMEVMAERELGATEKSAR